MKKLIINIVFFILPLIVFLVVVPIDNRSKYLGLNKDCFNHGIWIHDRIFNNNKAIDIAFLGSSHTITGIDDQMISSLIQNQEVVNLGYCRLGRNLHYVFAKELLNQKKIHHLILEIREDEDRYSHPIFPFVADTKDVLLPNPFFNRDIIIDIWSHLTYKVELIQNKIYHSNNSVDLQMEDFGFASSAEVADTSLMNFYLKERSIPPKPSSQLAKEFYGYYPKVYLNKINELCKENNVKLSFLYIPSYGSAITKPIKHEYYTQIGKVMLPPNKIWENQSNWSDENHLNQKGATELSKWISENLE